MSVRRRTYLDCGLRIADCGFETLYSFQLIMRLFCPPTNDEGWSLVIGPSSIVHHEKSHFHLKKVLAFSIRNSQSEIRIQGIRLNRVLPSTISTRRRKRPGRRKYPKSSVYFTYSLVLISVFSSSLISL